MKKQIMFGLLAILTIGIAGQGLTQDVFAEHVTHEVSHEVSGDVTHEVSHTTESAIDYHTHKHKHMVDTSTHSSSVKIVHTHVHNVNGHDHIDKVSNHNTADSHNHGPPSIGLTIFVGFLILIMFVLIAIRCSSCDN